MCGSLNIIWYKDEGIRLTLLYQNFFRTWIVFWKNESKFNNPFIHGQFKAFPLNPFYNNSCVTQNTLQFHQIENNDFYAFAPLTFAHKLFAGTCCLLDCTTIWPHNPPELFTVFQIMARVRYNMQHFIHFHVILFHLYDFGKFEHFANHTSEKMILIKYKNVWHRKKEIYIKYIKHK